MAIDRKNLEQWLEQEGVAEGLRPAAADILQLHATFQKVVSDEDARCSLVLATILWRAKLS